MKDQTTAPAQLGLQYLKLADIIPDPNQPRHYFNETDLQELTDSIRENGVLQAIMVRPIAGGKYMVVFGERRYRASLAVQTAFKNRDSIPCTIRELSDDQALEIQIVENLQRKDVAPMEEATAFKSLLDRQIMDLESIAARVGKSTKYVLLRIKLNDLIPEFQEMLNKDKLSLGGAQLLARYNQDLQYETLNYKSRMFHQDWRESKSFKMVNFEHILSNAQHKLSEAPFSIDDVIPEVCSVSCRTCPFNSANAPLLFDELKEPHCTKGSCYEQKKEISLNQRIEAAKSDHSTVLIASFWEKPYDPKEKARFTELSSQGLNIITRRDYTTIEAPEHPGTYEEWYEDNYSGDIEDEDERKEAEEDYNSALRAYEKEQKEYQEALDSGNVIDAMIAIGDDTGRVIKVKINDVVKEKVTNHSAQEEGPLFLIDQLQAKERRAQELDIEKIYLKGVDLLRNFYTSENDLKAPLDMEWNALCFMLYIIGNMGTRKWVIAQLGLPEKVYSDWYGMEVWDAINKKGVSGILEGLIRRCFLDYLISSSENDPNKWGKASTIFALAKTHMPEQIKEVIAAQTEKAQKRGAEVQKKIDDLKKQIKAHSKQVPAKKNQEK